MSNWNESELAVCISNFLEEMFSYVKCSLGTFMADA